MIPKTIKGKITLQVIAFITFALLVCEMICTHSLSSNMTSQTKSALRTQTQNNAATVNEWLSAQGNVVHTLRNAVVAMNTTDTEKIMDYLEQNLPENESALMYYVCFAYDGGVFPADHSKLDLDPTTRDWWKQAIETDGLIYTAPYKDFATGQMVVSIAEPMTLDGKQSVFLADITLDTITSLIDDISDDKNTQGFLLDADGNVIAHPNEKFLPTEDGNTILSDALGVDVTKVSELTDYDKQKKYIHTATVEATDWTLGITENTSSITSRITENIRNITIFGVIILLLDAFLMIYSIKKNLKPMENMKLFIREQVIGADQCRKQKNEVAEIQYLIDELEEKFIEIIRQTKGKSAAIHTRMKDTTGKVGSISENIMSISAAMEETCANIDT